LHGGPPALALLGGDPLILSRAIVFEASWDLAGALRIIYGDDTIRADVVTPNLRSLYGGLLAESPDRRLLLYTAPPDARVTACVSSDEARRPQARPENFP